MNETILCAHDLTGDSTPALRAALDLGRRLKTTVHVLYVLPPPLAISPDLWFAVPEIESEDFQRRILTAATQELERVARESRGEGDPKTRLHVNVGEPAQGILEAAKDLGAGLIVMGTHSRKGWQHFMIGSVAERVVRTAPVPVVTVSATAARAGKVTREAEAVAGA